MLRVCVCLALVVSVLSAPAVGQVVMGIQTGPDPVVPDQLVGMNSVVGFVDFDDFAAPGSFAQTTRVTSEFAAFGVVFEGPGGLDGGAVLNESSNFGVTGHSPPNFLAFNNNAGLGGGGTAQGPETMIFSPPAVDVTIGCGIGLGATGTVTLECFDVTGLSLGSDTINVSSALQPLTVTASDIATCVLSYQTSLEGVACDDLAFGQVPVELESFSIDK